VGVDHLAVQGVGQREAEGGLAGSGRPDDGDHGPAHDQLATKYPTPYGLAAYLTLLRSFCPPVAPASTWSGARPVASSVPASPGSSSSSRAVSTSTSASSTAASNDSARGSAAWRAAPSPSTS